MEFIKSKGIVIKKVDFGESDRVITILTEALGKIDIFVKGIRKSKKRDQSSTDVLALSDFTFYKKGEKYILSNIELIDNYYDIRKHIDKIEISSYMISIVNKISYLEQNRKNLFQRIQKALEFIQKNNEYNNYVMILFMLEWIVNDEGFLIVIDGYRYFNLEESLIGNEKKGNSIFVEENIVSLLKLIKSRLKDEITEERFSKKILQQTVLLYEKYLNYHLDININLYRHLLEGTHVKYS